MHRGGRALCRKRLAMAIGASGLLLAFYPSFVRAQAGETFLIASHGATVTAGPKGLLAAFDGAQFLVGLQGDIDSGHNIVAQFLSRDGTLLGPLVDARRTGGTPGVAFDGANFLLVWPDDAETSDGDIYGQIIAPNGTLIGDSLAISTASGEQAFHSLKPIAFGGGNYLVVWEDPRNGSEAADIYGQFVSPSGARVGAEIPLCALAERQREPAVEFNAGYFLVTWNSRRSGEAEFWDVQGRLISASGELGPILEISQAPSRRHNPGGIATDRNNFIVVWNRDIGNGFPNPADWDVYGRFVSPSGVFPANEFPIATAAGNQTFPMAGSDGANYLVSWFDDQTLNTTFRYFTPAGQPRGQPFAPFPAQENKLPIAVAGPFDGARFLALANLTDNPPFTNTDLRGAFILGSSGRPTLAFTNGNFPLTIDGVPGQNYAIQATADLSAPETWTSLQTINAAAGTFSFSDPDAFTLDRRNYRALEVP